MKELIVGTAFALSIIAATASEALADYERREATGSVSEVMDRLEAAVTEAGATVFARVDHGGGAQMADMDLGESELLIFGNPKLGTPVMQADPMAGLALPLKMLAYEDEAGQVWVAWEDVEEMLDDLEVDDDLPVLEQMEGALENFAEKAAG